MLTPNSNASDSLFIVSSEFWMLNWIWPEKSLLNTSDIWLSCSRIWFISVIISSSQATLLQCSMIVCRNSAAWDEAGPLSRMMFRTRAECSAQTSAADVLSESEWEKSAQSPCNGLQWSVVHFDRSRTSSSSSRPIAWSRMARMAARSTGRIMVWDLFSRSGTGAPHDANNVWMIKFDDLYSAANSKTPSFDDVSSIRKFDRAE